MSDWDDDYCDGHRRSSLGDTVGSLIGLAVLAVLVTAIAQLAWYLVCLVYELIEWICLAIYNKLTKRSITSTQLRAQLTKLGTWFLCAVMASMIATIVVLAIYNMIKEML